MSNLILMRFLLQSFLQKIKLWFTLRDIKQEFNQKIGNLGDIKVRVINIDGLPETLQAMQKIQHKISSLILEKNKSAVKEILDFVLQTGIMKFYEGFKKEVTNDHDMAFIDFCSSLWDAHSYVTGTKWSHASHENFLNYLGCKELYSSFYSRTDWQT